MHAANAEAVPEVKADKIRAERFVRGLKPEEALIGVPSAIASTEGGAHGQHPAPMQCAA